MLVDFYQRLSLIEGKVSRIRQTVASQQDSASTHRSRLQLMASRLAHPPAEALQMIQQHNTKDMGYELATALIEREIKTKLENQRLQAVIDQLQNDKKRMEEERRSADTSKTALRSTDKSEGSREKQSRYSDALDEASQEDSYYRKKSNSMSNSYFLDDTNRKYWEDAPAAQDETSFSAFSTPAKDKSQQYAGLNLWLYQFKPEEVEGSPIKALRKPAGRAGREGGKKGKA
jgi:hypothetical protein